MSPFRFACALILSLSACAGGDDGPGDDTDGAGSAGPADDAASAPDDGDDDGMLPDDDGLDDAPDPTQGPGEESAGDDDGSVPSQGCGGAPGDLSERMETIDAAGMSRTYWLVPPVGYDPDTAHPVLFAYHGSGDTGANFRSWSGLLGDFNQDAFVVLPDGVGGVWDLEGGGIDIAMFDAVMASLQTEYCIDEAAVFGAGFSYGGWMANALGCARGGEVAGVASIAGGGPFGGCTGPTAVFLVHGEADGAEGIGAGEASRDFWRDTNGCAAESTPADPEPCVALSGCPASDPVLWCAHPGAHEIPGFTGAGMWSLFTSL